MLIGGKQFFRTQNAEYIRQVAADFVLAPFAAVEGHEQRADAVAARLESQQAAVFVIGMSDYLHQARRGAEAEQFEVQPGEAFVLRNCRWNALIQQSGRI